MNKAHAVASCLAIALDNEQDNANFTVYADAAMVVTDLLAGTINRLDSVNVKRLK